jgi:hypothetical protein
MESKVENEPETTKMLVKEFKEFRKKNVLKYVEEEIKRTLNRPKAIKKDAKRSIENTRKGKYSAKLIAKIKNGTNNDIASFAASNSISKEQVDVARPSLNKYFEGMDRNMIDYQSCIIDGVKYNVRIDGGRYVLLNDGTGEVVKNSTVVEKERIIDIEIDNKLTTVVFEISPPPQ